MMDSIENGGMKPYRSQLFQREIIKALNEFSTDYQIIFCTSMVLEDLNNDSYGVGPYHESNVISF